MKIPRKYYGILAAFFLVLAMYFGLAMLMSATMVDISYFLYINWPPPVRFVYVLLSMYLIYRGLTEDY